MLQISNELTEDPGLFDVVDPECSRILIAVVTISLHE